MTVFPIRYLKILDAVTSYVIAVDGLPSEYYNLDPEKAEDLAAWSGHIVRTATEKMGATPPVTAVLETPSADYIIREENGSAITVVAKPGYGPPVARALSGKGPRCGNCGADLSLAVVVCPECGARNPYTAERCSSCGRPLRDRRCPRCGSRIDVGGAPVGLRERLIARPARVELVLGHEEG